MANHKLELNFAASNNERTKVSCECGVACGTVKTGTSLYEILALFSEHITKENDGEDGKVLPLQKRDQDDVP